MIPVPALDVLDGKCVRLSQGDYNDSKIYAEDPVDMAKSLEDKGMTHLHLVDLEGARSGKIIHHRILEKISQSTQLKIDFGGGIKSDEAIQMAFDYGADQVTGGSIAQRNPELFCRWLEKYGPERLILGADVRDGKIAVNGWLETTETTLFEFLKFYKEKGIQYVICTDISKDGKMAGPGMNIYQSVIDHFPELKLIASGGIRSVADLKCIEAAGIYGAIIGKALYEGKIKPEELLPFYHIKNK